MPPFRYSIVTLYRDTAAVHVWQFDNLDAAWDSLLTTDRTVVSRAILIDHSIDDGKHRCIAIMEFPAP